MDTVIAVGKANISGLLAGGIFPRCEVICADGITEMSAERCVVVAGEGAKLPKELAAFAVIVDADADFCPENLRGNAVITCGISGKNTVSITSKTADMITLSLNRSVHTQNGLCEPLELPVKRADDHTDFDYMAAFAAAVVLGRM